jgi:hypothetical protein
MAPPYGRITQIHSEIRGATHSSIPISEGVTPFGRRVPGRADRKQGEL